MLTVGPKQPPLRRCPQSHGLFASSCPASVSLGGTGSHTADFRGSKGVASSPPSPDTRGTTVHQVHSPCPGSSPPPPPPGAQALVGQRSGRQHLLGPERSSLQNRRRAPPGSGLPSRFPSLLEYTEEALIDKEFWTAEKISMNR